MAPPGTVDLVTVAQAIHWFDLQIFYKQVKLVLKKPNGVIAIWCYDVPRVTANVDNVFEELFKVKLRPYWDSGLEIWEDSYRSLDFPFEAVEATEEGTGVIEFVTEKEMDLEDYLMYVKSISAYQTAKEKGAEIPWEEYDERLKNAWFEDGCCVKIARYPILLRIGKVGDA